MKYLTIIPLLLLLAACSGSPSEPGSTSALHALHEHSAPLYQCPMHPQITSDKPGECPICGMDLVRVEEGKKDQSDKKSATHPEGHTEIHIPRARQQIIGVKTAAAQIKPVFKKIHVPGQIAFDPELYTAQIEYQEALRQYDRVRNSPLASVKSNVQRMVEAARIRLKVLGLSEEQIRDLRKGQDLGEGLLVYEKGAPAWIYADVFERDLPSIKKGLAAQIEASWLEGETLAGTVESVDQVIHPETRTAKVRVRIARAPVQLRAQSYVNVTILAPQGKHLVVPFDAVLDTGKEQFVFLAKEKGHFEPRKVRIRFESGDEIAIRDGLQEGEIIVVGANFLLDSESRLKGALQDMRTSHADHSAH